MSKMKIGLVGLGKIAKDQHIPSLRASPDFELIAAASQHGELDEGRTYKSVEEMLAAEPELQAVGLCTPPQVRHVIARTALSHGKHVLLEKPPGATLSEVDDLIQVAAHANVTLFASWHSRFAPGVEPAREWLATRRIKSVEVQWKEDVRIWHPGQTWIWQAGGLGVFDPAINALSIVTRILPRPFFLSRADLGFPVNQQAPVDAVLDFVDDQGLKIHAELDFLQTGPQTWDIYIDTDQGRLTLESGGARLIINGQVRLDEKPAEYPGLYSYFAGLIRQGRSDVDVSPLKHVADAFMLGERRVAPAFDY